MKKIGIKRMSNGYFIKNINIKYIIFIINKNSSILIILNNIINIYIIIFYNPLQLNKEYEKISIYYKEYL